MKTVLIFFHDDIHILKELKRLVKKALLELHIYQSEVLIASSSAKAAEVLRSTRIDLLFIEYTSEENKFIEYVKTIPQKDASVLIIKNPDMVPKFLNGENGKFSDILVRPISRDRLKEVLRKFLSRSI